jgi:multidrug efflux pump
VAIAGTLVKRSVVALAVFGIILLLSGFLFRIIPSSFLPEEDQGYFISVVQLPDGASLQRTDAVLSKLEQYYLSIPVIHSTDALAGQNFVFGTRGSNSATMFTPLMHWDQRKRADQHVKALIAASWREFAKIPEAMILAFNAPAIRGLGATGGFSAQVQDPSGGDFRKFADTAQEFLAKVKQDPAIGAFFGNLYINDFLKFGRVYRVQTEGKPEYRSKPEDISKVYVRASSEQRTSMVPLDTVVSTQYTSGPDPVTHFIGVNTALVLGGAAPGFSSGQALDALERAAREVLIPKGYSLDLSGISYQERQVGNRSVIAFGFGLLMVFLVLAAQYESWSVPFAVILAVPFGVFGALCAVWLAGISNDIYFQIGLVTLIGLAAKNAILIVEFANHRREAGTPIVDAAIEAAKLRFRPIIMTSMAFILGVVPLVLATGAGAASRRSIGTGVFGGMLSATLLAVLFVPLFFVLVSRLTQRMWRKTNPVVVPAGSRTEGVH